jgi:hypothetical protein
MPEVDVVIDLMAKPRVTITLSEEVHQILAEWADQEERPLANLVVYIVSKAAKEYQQQKETPSSTKDKDSNA